MGIKICSLEEVLEVALYKRLLSKIDIFVFTMFTKMSLVSMVDNLWYIIVIDFLFFFVIFLLHIKKDPIFLY